MDYTDEEFTYCTKGFTPSDLQKLNPLIFHTSLTKSERESLDENDRQWVMRMSLKFEESVPRELFEQLLTRFYKNNWKLVEERGKSDTPPLRVIVVIEAKDTKGKKTELSGYVPS